jgi:periplasmic protein TonB
MTPSSQDQARRVVEEPKRSAAPYFAIAVIAAVALWSFMQPGTESPESQPNPASSDESAQGSGSHVARGDVRTIFSTDDYPAAALQRGEEGTVQAVLAVDSRGRVTKCTILRSSGSATLDSTTCRLLQKRARFTPARDADGRPVPDQFTTPPIKWQLED